MKTIYQQIREHTDANEHTKARIAATAAVMRIWDRLHAGHEMENPMRAFLGAFGVIDDQAHYTGHITTEIARARERLWIAFMKTAEDEGEAYANIVHKMNEAM